MNFRHYLWPEPLALAEVENHGPALPPASTSPSPVGGLGKEARALQIEPVIGAHGVDRAHSTPDTVSDVETVSQAGVRNA